MNQYPKTAVVQAQYSGQQRGNPFLEAMPSIMPYKMLMDEIASGPLIPVRLPEMSLEERQYVNTQAQQPVHTDGLYVYHL